MIKEESFLVWRDDEDETVEDARRIKASSHREAAEMYAARLHSGSDPFDSIDLHIKREGADEVRCITVDAEMEITFSSFDNGPLKPEEKAS